MKKTTLCAALLLCATTQVVLAKDGYSAAYSQCMDAAGGVTSSMNECNGAEIKRQDARLNQGYKAAMAGLEPAQQGKLRDAQRAWIKYRDTNCAMYYTLTGGTIDLLNGAACTLSMTKARADELATLLGP